MKLSAWGDRYAARDLFDLAGLVGRGAFTPATASIFRDLTGHPPDMATSARIPDVTRDSWRQQLGHQPSDVGDPDAFIAGVASAVAGILPP